MSYLVYQGKFIQTNGHYSGYVAPIAPIDPSFNVGAGFPAALFSIIKDSEEKIYVAGNFTQYDGSLANRIIRLNPNGSRDLSFNTGTGFDSGVSSLAFDNNGKIMATGLFSSYNGNSVNRVARLNTDGTFDNTFNPSTLLGTGNVTAVVVDSNDKIYLGGAFNQSLGAVTNRLIRLNSDGTRDLSFDVSNGFAESNSWVWDLALNPSGKLLVMGAIVTYRGVSVNGAVLLNDNGTIDSGFSVGTGWSVTSQYPNSVAFDQTGKMYFGGAFTLFNGSSQSRVVKLNTDGTKDTSFDISTGFNNGVTDVKIDSNGKIYVSGDFTTYRNQPANRIIRLNTDGSPDILFDSSTGANNSIRKIRILSSGNMIIGGNFTTFKGATQNRIVKLDPSGNKV